MVMGVGGVKLIIHPRPSGILEIIKIRRKEEEEGSTPNIISKK
jgi:hypothetical protein